LRMEPRPTVIFVVGKDILAEPGTGGSTYAAAHACAAQRIGFEPHLFALGTRCREVETEFGTIHVIRSNLPLRLAPHRSFRTIYLPLHAEPLTRAVVEFAQRRDGGVLLHGFGTAGGVAVAAADRLRRAGTSASVVVNAYTTAKHESAGKLRGLRETYAPWTRAAQRVEHWWISSAVAALERRGFAGADSLVVNYESVRKLIEHDYGLGAKAVTRPYASQRAFRETECAGPNRPRSGPVRILTVARHDARKGLDRLLRAFALLVDLGLRFRADLVGTGALLATHRQLATKLGLDGVVRFHGFVPDPCPFLEDADIFVLPSLEEGSGSVAVLEAMQAGVPIVASRVDGIPEDITDGREGLLVEPGSVGALTQALQRLICDADLRAAMGRNARETFERRFSAETLSRSLGELYAGLGFVGAVGEPRPGRPTAMLTNHPWDRS
jgi:glycosyltransferase involved in cell wall biosynthesis